MLENSLCLPLFLFFSLVEQNTCEKLQIPHIFGDHIQLATQSIANIMSALFLFLLFEQMIGIGLKPLSMHQVWMLRMHTTISFIKCVSRPKPGSRNGLLKKQKKILKATEGSSK